MKKIILSLLIFLVVSIGCTQTNTIDFQYSNPNQNIPKELLMDFNKALLYTNTCESGDTPEKYVLFNFPDDPCPEDYDVDGCGGGFERTAYKCGNKYIINEILVTNEEAFYGPFYLENETKHSQITQYLEDNAMGNRPNGANFCSYTIFNDNPDENPLYMLVSCSEYYPTSTKAICEEGLESIKKLYSMTEEEIQEYCNDDTLILDQGTASAAVPMKITIHEDGSITHWEASDGSLHYESIKNAYPDDILQKYLSKEYDNREELIKNNALRAMEYFNLDLSEGVKDSW